MIVGPLKTVSPWTVNSDFNGPDWTFPSESDERRRSLSSSEVSTPARESTAIDPAVRGGPIAFHSAQVRQLSAGGLAPGSSTQYWWLSPGGGIMMAAFNSAIRELGGYRQAEEYI